jgi:hypothetical protein
MWRVPYTTDLLRTKRLLAAVGVVAGGALLAACGGGSSSGTPVAATKTLPAHTRSPKPTPTPTTTVSITPVPTTTVTVTASSSPAAAASNLTASNSVRQQLVAAGAATHQLPASDFTGLVPGETYYAADNANSTYWAGAGLVPSSSSMDAQVSVQDDGSYLIFKRSASGGWNGYNVGLAGIAGSTCQIKVPAAVLAVWHWKPHTCRPPS